MYFCLNSLEITCLSATVAKPEGIPNCWLHATFIYDSIIYVHGYKLYFDYYRTRKIRMYVENVRASANVRGTCIYMAKTSSKNGMCPSRPPCAFLLWACSWLDSQIVCVFEVTTHGLKYIGAYTLFESTLSHSRISIVHLRIHVSLCTIGPLF